MSDRRKRTSTDRPQHVKFTSDSDSDDGGSPDPYKEKAEEVLVKKCKPVVPDVHSFNDWEHADLGNDEKKAKFLRLMGANKSQRKTQSEAEEAADIIFGKADTSAAGDAGTGDADTAPTHSKHGRDASEDKQLQRNLEREYNSCMDNHLRMRDQRHRGLGWNSGTRVDLGAAEEKLVETTKEEKKSDLAKTNNEAKTQSSSPTGDSGQTHSAVQAAVKAKFGMKFVSGGNK